MNLHFEVMCFFDTQEGRNLQRECDREHLTLPEAIKRLTEVLPEYATNRQAEIEKENRWCNMLTLMDIEHRQSTEYGIVRYPITETWEEEYNTATEEDQKRMTELMYIYLSPREKEFSVPFI